jgi:hypothetical protein
MGLRLLDPTFFFRSVHVFFDVHAVNESGTGAATPTSSVCRRRILVATEYGSTLGDLWNHLSGHGVDNILSYASLLLPSMKVCKEVHGPRDDLADVEVHGSGLGDADHDDGEDDAKAVELEVMARRKQNNCYVKLRRTTANATAAATAADGDSAPTEQTPWAAAWTNWNNTWATCDEHCRCELSLPALHRGMRFTVVRESLAARDSVFAVTGVQLNAFPPLRLAVFVAALAVWRLHDGICENRLFQVGEVRFGWLVGQAAACLLCNQSGLILTRVLSRVSTSCLCAVVWCAVQPRCAPRNRSP